MDLNKLHILLESVVDVTRNTLDLQLFDKTNTLKSEAVEELQNIINYIDENIVTVNDAMLKGSILSYQWTEECDIDLLIEIDDIDDNEWRRLQDEVEDYIEDKMLLNTEHPIQIYLFCGEYDLDNADGIYYLDDRQWGKGPYNIHVRSEEYASKFDRMVASIDMVTGELRRNLIDYNKLKDLSKEDIEGLEKLIDKKLQKINGSIDDLVFHYNHIKAMRQSAFAQDLSPEKIIQYGSKNKLPENVVFKLLERFYYFDFIKQLKHIVDDNDIDSDEDVKDVKEIYNDFQQIT